MQIEIAWVDPSGRVCRLALELDSGALLRDALARIDDPAVLEELGRGMWMPAVHGRPADELTMLQPGDRIELLAGLKIDPKLARRLRAEVRRRSAAQVAPAAQR